jgi:hypothetical protein
LRDARFVQPDHFRNFPQRQLFVIVKTEDRPLYLRDLINRFRQQPLQL